MDITGAEIDILRSQGRTWKEIEQETGENRETVRSRHKRYLYDQAAGIQPKRRIQASPYPQYIEPLQMDGDALVLFDTEFPFHNADFLNRVLELADRWAVRQCVIGGDVLHFEQFSQWEASWVTSQTANKLSEDAERELRELIQALPPEHQGALLDKLATIATGEREESELGAAKKALLTLGEAFDRIDYVIGNHDDRFIRALKSPLLPQSLLDFIGLTDPRWRIGPYYYSILVSNKEKYRIEHPRSAAANTAVKLADKYECHILTGHSHLQSIQWSTSGNYFAIHAGCVVDETRLAYAAQRSSNRPAHKLGAVIVRDGFPWVLNDRYPWEMAQRMK